MSEKPIFKFAVREDLQDCEINFLPKQATAFATGWDVKAAFKDKLPLTIHNGIMVKIPLGFRVFCPDGWWLELRPRSSTFAKKHLHCLYGVIDQDFEGQLILAAQLIPDSSSENTSLTIEFGEAIGQIVPVKRNDIIVERITNEEYDSLCLARNTERGTGCFGSSDKK